MMTVYIVLRHAYFVYINLCPLYQICIFLSHKSASPPEDVLICLPGSLAANPFKPYNIHFSSFTMIICCLPYGIFVWIFLAKIIAGFEISVRVNMILIRKANFKRYSF